MTHRLRKPSKRPFVIPDLIRDSLERTYCGSRPGSKSGVTKASGKTIEASGNHAYTPLQILVNGGGQTLAWTICVTGAARDQHHWAPFSFLMLLALHGLLHQRTIWPTTLKLVAAGLLFGLAFDSALIAAGVYIPQRWFLPGPLPPLWFLVLWVNFAMCLHVAFRPLQRRPLLAACVGGFFGPSAFLGANRLGALTLPEPTWWRLTVLACGWALGVLALTQFARYLTREPYEPQATDLGMKCNTQAISNAPP